MWAEELRAFEPSSRVVLLTPTSLGFDDRGEVLAWTSERQGLRVVRLDTGQVVHRERGAVALAVAGPWTFFLDGTSGRLVRLHRDGAREERPWTLPRPTGLRADPRGDRLLVELSDGLRLLSWADAEPVPLPGSHLRTVRWDEDVVLVADRDPQAHQTLQTISLSSGEELLRVEGRGCWLGRGWVATLGCGIVAQRPGGASFVVLPHRPGDRGAPIPSLSRDQRRLRLAVEPRILVSLEVDLERGVLVRGTDDVLHLDGDERAADRWHPHADACALFDGGPGVFPRRYVVRDRAGQVELPLPPSANPLAWIADGHGLLVQRPGRRETHVEVWRAP